MTLLKRKFMHWIQNSKGTKGFILKSKHLSHIVFWLSSSAFPEIGIFFNDPIYIYIPVHKHMLPSDTYNSIGLFPFQYQFHNSIYTKVALLFLKVLYILPYAWNNNLVILY